MRAPAGDGHERAPDSRASGAVPSSRAQRTIARAVETQANGLHSGEMVRARLVPAPADAGIVFVRADLPGSPRVAATAENRVTYARRTALEHAGVEVHTIEHL